MAASRDCAEFAPITGLAHKAVHDLGRHPISKLDALSASFHPAWGLLGLVDAEIA
jgi:hypothetical protein